MPKLLIVLLWWSLLLTCGTAAPLAAADEFLDATVLHVSDGDTIKVKVGTKKWKVRLLGIDAPETKENPRALSQSNTRGVTLAAVLDQGRRSHEHMEKLLGKNKGVRLEFDVQNRDRYGRLLAYVYLADGTMLNEKMVADGYAMLLTYPPNVKHVRKLKAALRLAQSLRKGLWADDTERPGNQPRKGYLPKKKGTQRVPRT